MENNINCLEKKNRKNNKETYIKKYKFPNLVNQSIIKELMDISKYIGSNNPGNGSLILNLDIIFQKNTKNKIIKRKITNQVFHFSLFKKNYKSNLIVSKLNEFKITFNKFTRKKSEILSLKNKSILIFGSSGNLGSYAKFFFSKYNVLLNLADRDPTSINKKKLKFFKIEILIQNNLRKIILNTKPDYIFYFLSPRIQKISNLKFDKKLFKDFNFVYYIYLKKIIKNLNLLNKKVALFYPSTIALDTTHNNFKFLKEYILAKAKAEKICNNTINNVKIISYRIPQIKSPQNYNIAGFYEGCSTKILKKYIDDFLIKSQNY